MQINRIYMSAQRCCLSLYNIISLFGLGGKMKFMIRGPIFSLLKTGTLTFSFSSDKFFFLLERSSLPFFFCSDRFKKKGGWGGGGTLRHPLEINRDRGLKNGTVLCESERQGPLFLIIPDNKVYDSQWCRDREGRRAAV